MRSSCHCTERNRYCQFAAYLYGKQKVCESLDAMTPGRHRPCRKLTSFSCDLQTTSPQRAVAALQLAVQHKELSGDADVAAENAAMQAICAHWISAQSHSAQTAKGRSHGKPAEYPQRNGGLDNSIVQCIGHSSSCEDVGHLQACLVPSIIADLSENGAVLLPAAGSCDSISGQHQDSLKAAFTNPTPER